MLKTDFQKVISQQLPHRFLWSCVKNIWCFLTRNCSSNLVGKIKLKMVQYLAWACTYSSKSELEW